MQNQPYVGGMQITNNNQYPNNNQQNIYQGGTPQVYQINQQPIYGQQMQYGMPIMTNPTMIIPQSNGIIGQYRELPFQANYSPFPMQITCPNCNKQGFTVIRNEIGAGTYLASCGLLLFTGLLCCWIPFCMVDMQDKIHLCSSCGQEVGIRPYGMSI